jgi:hypothetical protein
MERIRLVFEQIEEAKRLLEDGSILKLRLATILLDNVAEILMNRELRYRFAWDDRGQFLGKQNAYSPEERKNAERRFDEKVRLLIRLGKLSKDQGAVIDAGHQFRSEMFHVEQIRRPILRPAAVLLFHTVIDLSDQLLSRSYMLPGPSEKESQAFIQRFGIGKGFLLDDEFPKKIGAVLRAGISFNPSGLPAALSEDLVERVDQTLTNLKYVSEGSSEQQIDRQLRYSQFWRTEGYKLAEATAGEKLLDEAFDEWNSNGNAQYTLSRLRKWRRTAELIVSCPAPMALRHYCGVDKKFRPFEEEVHETVFQFEEHIDGLIEEERIRESMRR